MSDARRFFLGKMAEGERAAFEAQFVADGEMFELIRVCEDELVEEYVRGLLSRSERHAFENDYLTTAANQQKVEFTRALIAKVTTPAVAIDETPWLESISAFFLKHRLVVGSVLGILLILVGVWLFLPRSSGPEIAKTIPPVDISPTVATPPAANTQDYANSEAVIPTPTASPRDVNRPTEKPRETTSTTPFLALFAGSVRGGGSMPTLALDNSDRKANLSLNLESRDYDRYRAEIVDPDGNVIYRSGILRPSGKRIGLLFPITNVKSGEYSVRLLGVTRENTTESAADLSFRVIRK